MYDNNQSRQLKNKLLLITNSGGGVKYTKKTAQKSEYSHRPTTNITPNPWIHALEEPPVWTFSQDK